MALKISLNPSRAALFHAADEPFKPFQGPRMAVPVADNSRADVSFSKKARNRIRNAINWMTFLSERRNVSTVGRQIIPNFQISFITLTLPTKQLHSHKEIKAKCLNRFLTVARAKWGVENYVWKLELQKNGNAHFHLTFDKYVHFMAIRREWNAAIAKLGYIAEYAKTFQNMDFETYHYWRCEQGSQNRDKNRKAHSYGTSTGWNSPNTTDVKKVKDIKNLASYLSKYLTKPPADAETTGLIADSADQLTGRLWFCSQSLSRLGNCLIDYDVKIGRALAILRKLAGVFRIQGDWVELFFFRIGKLPRMLREFLRQELVSHAVTAGYPFPAGAVNAGV